MLNLGSSIHIRYSNIFPLQRGKIDAMMESLMDPKKSEKVLEEASGENEKPKKKKKTQREYLEEGV